MFKSNVFKPRIKLILPNVSFAQLLLKPQQPEDPSPFSVVCRALEKIAEHFFYSTLQLPLGPQHTPPSPGLLQGPPYDPTDTELFWQGCRFDVLKY